MLCRIWRCQRDHHLDFIPIIVKTTSNIFAHKGKINTSFGTVKGLRLFVCTLFAS